MFITSENSTWLFWRQSQSIRFLPKNPPILALVEKQPQSLFSLLFKISLYPKTQAPWALVSKNCHKNHAVFSQCLSISLSVMITLLCAKISHPPPDCVEQTQRKGDTGKNTSFGAGKLEGKARPNSQRNLEKLLNASWPQCSHPKNEPISPTWQDNCKD